MTLIISHTGPYDFYWQRNATCCRLQWGYLNVFFSPFPPTVVIPALTEAMRQPQKEDI